jgi:hypothetical protein
MARVSWASIDLQCTGRNQPSRISWSEIEGLSGGSGTSLPRKRAGTKKAAVALARKLAGVVVLDAPDLPQARFKAAACGKDCGLEFASGDHIHPLSAEQIPANMMGRLLNHGDLRKLRKLWRFQRILMKLQAMLLKKNPPAPSVRRQERRRTAAKRTAGKP